jgi:hypothetical protein
MASTGTIDRTRAVRRHVVTGSMERDARLAVERRSRLMMRTLRMRIEEMRTRRKKRTRRNDDRIDRRRAIDPIRNH